MEDVIESGGSVLHEGKLHTSAVTLPSKAALASSEQEKAAAGSDLDAQIAELQKQRDALNKTGESVEDSNLDDSFEELMKHKREELVERAGQMQIEVAETATKAEISELILEAQKTERIMKI